MSAGKVHLGNISYLKTVFNEDIYFSWETASRSVKFNEAVMTNMV